MTAQVVNDETNDLAPTCDNIQVNKGKTLERRFPPLEGDKLKWFPRDVLPEEIPAIDISKVETKEELEQFLVDIRKSGLFYIVNHGVPEEVSINVYNAFREFISTTTEEERMKYYTDTHFQNGGYVPFQGSSIAGGNMGKTQKDHVVKYFWRGPEVVNRTPCEEFTKAHDAHHTETANVAEKVIRTIFRALKLRFPDFDSAEYESNICQKKMFFTNRIYPQVEQSDEEELTHRLVPHLDTSFITLANQVPADNGFQGLFVETGDGKKVPVPGIRNSYLVFIGQSLSFLTKNYLPSALHGVDKPPKEMFEGSERASLISFYEPAEIMIPSKHINPNPDETTDSCPFFDGIGLSPNDPEGTTWDFVKNKFITGYYAD